MNFVPKYIVIIYSITFLFFSCKKEEIEDSSETSSSSSSLRDSSLTDTILTKDSTDTVIIIDTVNNNLDTTNSNNSQNHIWDYHQNPIQEFIVNSDNPISITTEAGTQIDFPQNCFLNSLGIVEGEINIHVKEIYNKVNIIQEQVFTNAENEILETQGEFLITAYKDGEELSFAEHKKFFITPNQPLKEGMKSWYLEDKQDPFWVYKGDTLEQECIKFSQLIKDLDYIDPRNEGLIFSNKLDEIRDMFNMRRLELGILDTFTINIFMDDGSDVFFNSENEYWIVEAYGLAGRRDSIVYNTTHEQWPSYYPGNEWGKIVNCGVEFNSQMISFDPNAIKLPFNQMGWCNIDRIISEYGGIKDCSLSVAGIPSNAQVVASLSDIVSVVSLNSGGDGLFTGQLPEGAPIDFIVYYKIDNEFFLSTFSLISSETMLVSSPQITKFNSEKALQDAINAL